MEDPTRFDVWANPTPGRTNDVKALLRQYRADLSERELLTELAQARAYGRRLGFALALGWMAATQWRSESALTDVRILQAGLGPDLSRLAHCETHDVWFGGILGCPVCGGRHEG